MGDCQDFLDNLENLQLVMAVALEHTQDNAREFLNNASGLHTRHAEKLISQVRGVAEQLEKEFAALERQLAKTRSN